MRITHRLGVALACVLAGATLTQGQQLPDLWAHIYHPARLKILLPMATVTGTLVDATHGKRKNGCRPEKDGDFHCWIRLDKGQEEFINQVNIDRQDSNLVWEPICQHTPTQADAIESCSGFHQQISIPPIGSRVRLTGSHVLDTQHGWLELHPVSHIELIPPITAPTAYQARSAKTFNLGTAFRSYNRP